jgi:hypothetical protein
MPVLTVVFLASKLWLALPFINVFASGSTFSVTFSSGTGSHLLFRRFFGVDFDKGLELFALLYRTKISIIIFISYYQNSTILQTTETARRHNFLEYNGRTLIKSLQHVMMQLIDVCWHQIR